MYAIRDIDLDLGQGDLFGFIGPNGAGKTTTMRIIATLLTPTYGEAYVCGHSIYTHPKEIRRLVGYMPDFFGVYDDMTVIEYLDFFAAAYRIAPQARRKRCDEMLEVVDLEFKRDAYANTLSRGQTQRLGLARVLLHDPAVLLLDEPLSGLDPRARIEMRALMRRLGAMGKTVIVSSHILPELADVCNKVGIIDSGKMIASDDVASMIRQVRPNMALLVEPGQPSQLEAAAKLLSNHPLVQSVDIVGHMVKATLKVDAGDYSDLASMLITSGIAIKRFAEEEINLESAFMAFTKGAGSKDIIGVESLALHCRTRQVRLRSSLLQEHFQKDGTNMLKLPVIKGVIERRILANYRIDPEVMRAVLPQPFRPLLVKGYGLGGICLIRLRGIRPRFVPMPWGIGSENAAHRFAVEWDSHGKKYCGVYIPRRDSSSWINNLVGGRIFPGVTSSSQVRGHRNGNGSFSVSLTSLDCETHVVVAGTVSPDLPSSSVFGSLAEASEFFKAGALGYSNTHNDGRFDGIELRCKQWKVKALLVTKIESSYFEDSTRFPKGSIEFDCALLMRNIAHEWHGREDLCC